MVYTSNISTLFEFRQFEGLNKGYGIIKKAQYSYKFEIHENYTLFILYHTIHQSIMI